MYDSVLLPTDMSKGVDHAISHAIAAADDASAELHVLYVVDADAYSSYPGDEYVHEFEGLEAALENAGRDAVEEIRSSAEPREIDVTTEIRHGVPHEEILGYMDEHDIGLTVLGSKRRSGEYRQMLGSVAERVARSAQRPVSIVKTPVDE